MPYKQFTPVTLTASDVNTYLMKQSVMVFATAAARATALPLPDEGMVTYIAATDVMEFYDGTNWVRTGTPAGVVSPFAGSTAPTGWLLCYGQAVSRTTYADLFASLGTTYGAGNGSTTFNLPDLRGRVAAGRDVDMSGSGGTGLTNRLTSAISGVDGTALGGSGGDQRLHQHAHANTLTDPTHNHSQNSHDHSGTANENASTSFLRVVGVAGTILDYNHAVGRGSGAFVDYSGGAAYPQHSHPLTVNGRTATNIANSTGVSINNVNQGSGASQNVQPTVVMNYIIKV